MHTRLLCRYFSFSRGIFCRPEHYATYAAFLRHKTLRLLLPYVIFSLINYVYWLLVARHFGADADPDVSLTLPLLGILFGFEPWMYFYKPLWFLPCLMVTEILFYSLWRLSTALHKAYLLPLFAFGLSAIGNSLSCMCVPPLPFALGGVLTMMLFYYLGYFFASRKNTICSLFAVQTVSSWYLVVIALVFAAICGVLSLQTATTSVHKNSYGNALFALPTALCGCLALSCIAILIAKLPPLRLLQYIGTHTLVIFGIHLTVASLIKGFTVFVCQLPLSTYERLGVRFLLVIATVFCSLPFCFLYDKIVSSKRFFTKSSK